MTRRDRAELSERFARVLEKLLGQPAELTLVVRSDRHGNQQLLVQWGTGAWTGEVTATRKGARELDAKEVGALLSLLDHD